MKWYKMEISIVLTNSHKPTTLPTTQNIPKPESLKNQETRETSKLTSKKFLPVWYKDQVDSFGNLGLFLLM